MKIENHALLEEFRSGRVCEVCEAFSPGGLDPHHCPARGLASGSRLDTRVSLIACCRTCHAALHAGSLRVDLQEIIAKREGVPKFAVIDVCWFLIRLPKDADEKEIMARAKEELLETPRKLAIKTLKEAGKLT